MKFLRLLGTIGTALGALVAFGVLLMGLSYLAKPSTPTVPTEAPAGGGQAYVQAMDTALVAHGYQDFASRAAVQGGKFKVASTGLVGRCTVEVKWIVGPLTPVQQVAPLPAGTVVKFKLDTVQDASGAMAAGGFPQVNPTPDDIRAHLARPESPCQP